MFFCIYLSYSRYYNYNKYKQVKKLNLLHKKLKTSKIYNSIITTMIGFTADFFGALQTTLTDNSLSNSNCQRSLSNINKSQILKEIKQQSLVCISEKVLKMIKIIVFDQIFIYGLIKKRRQNKTSQNIFRRYYKIQLTLNLKFRSLSQNAFNKILRFTKQFNMADIKSQFPPYLQQSFSIKQFQGINQELQTNKLSKPQMIQQSQKIAQYPHIQQNFFKKQNAFSKKESEAQIYIAYKQQNTKVKYASKMIETLQYIFSQRKKIKTSFQKICQYEQYLDKKSYLISVLIYMFHSVQRPCFLKILNHQKQKSLIQKKLKQSQVSGRSHETTLKQSRMLIKNQQSKINQISKNQQSNTQSYGLQQKKNFRKSSKNKDIRNQQLIKSSHFNNSDSQLTQSKVISGLKFHKCVKKKSQNLETKKEKIQKKSQPKIKNGSNSNSRPNSRSNSRVNSKPNGTVKQNVGSNQVPKIIKQVNIKFDIKSYNIENIKTKFQQPYERIENYRNFNTSNKNYYLPSQNFKFQEPDLPDQPIIFYLLQQRLIQNQLYSSRSQKAFQQYMTQSRMNKPGSSQGLIYHSRIQKVDQKKPLQFSNKKKSKSKGKNSIRNSNIKSQQSDFQPVNIQSLKSYYFPENQQMGKIQPTIHHAQSSKFIGSEKWKGNQKKRVTTEVNLRQVKSSDKLNPYLQQLKQKQRILKKPTEKVVSLNKMVEKSLSAKSSSKISRQESKKLQKQYGDIFVHTNQYKSVKTNLSPASKLSDNKKPTVSIVPKEWKFVSKNNIPSISSPLKNVRQSKIGAEFQKYIQSHTKY